MLKKAHIIFICAGNSSRRATSHSLRSQNRPYRHSDQWTVWSTRWYCFRINTNYTLLLLSKLSSPDNNYSANILLDKHFEPKIADFGLARLGPENGKTYCYLKTKNAHGTLAYLPEEYKRSSKLSTKVDVYSLGVVSVHINKSGFLLASAHIRHSVREVSWPSG